MINRIRALAAALVAVALLMGASGCTTFSDSGRDKYYASEGGAVTTTSTSTSTTVAPTIPYNVSGLLHPTHKYLGLAAPGIPQSLAGATAFATAEGKATNLIEFYSSWGEPYQVAEVQQIWKSGALPYVAIEPNTKSLAQIAAGVDDNYIHQYAQAVRSLNLPVAISFAHEMNGGWFSWGTKSATAAEFVAAWRHMHDIFAQEGATEAIWVWSPNVINPVRTVKLKPYWPGDGYVDWVGVIGYYSLTGESTFKTLFGPTMAQVRAFTARPFIIAETASEGGARKPADIADLFKSIAKRSDVIGFVWFDFKKEADWRITSGPASAAEFRRQVANPLFGFDVKHP
jgi:hypothetical protein